MKEGELMFNSTPEPEQRRRVVNAAGLNGFLTKMYGFVGLSVFVSAISSFLVMTTFRAAVFGYFYPAHWDDVAAVIVANCTVDGDQC
jgi:hypothetical protein